jgi:hypothetical protein
VLISGYKLLENVVINATVIVVVIVAFAVCARVGLGVFRILLRVAFLAGGGIVLYRTQHSTMLDPPSHNTLISSTPPLTTHHYARPPLSQHSTVLDPPSHNTLISRGSGSGGTQFGLSSVRNNSFSSPGSHLAAPSPLLHSYYSSSLFEASLPVSLQAIVDTSTTATMEPYLHTTSDGHGHGPEQGDGAAVAVAREKMLQAQAAAEITLRERARLDAYLWSWLPVVYVITVAVLGEFRL